VALDPTPYVREAVVALLKAAAAPRPVPSTRVYPQETPPDPVWPFVKYGLPNSTPFVASCLDGANVDFSVHAFAASDATGGGEEKAGAILRWIVAVLSSASPVNMQDVTTCPFPATLFFEWTRSQVFRDSPTSSSAFHGVASFTATVAS